MADLLKVNVVVADLGQVHSAAHKLKALAQHLRFENSQIEITVTPGKFPGEVVTQEHLAALEKDIATMKASTDQLEKAVQDAPDSLK